MKIGFHLGARIKHVFVYAPLSKTGWGLGLGLGIGLGLRLGVGQPRGWDLLGPIKSAMPDCCCPSGWSS